MTERAQELEEALFDLVSKLDIVHEAAEYKSVWTVHQIHCGPYRGLTYEAELTQAKRVLQRAGGEPARQRRQNMTVDDRDLIAELKNILAAKDIELAACRSQFRQLFLEHLERGKEIERLRAELK
jgi:hypothetical protein